MIIQKALDNIKLISCQSHLFFRWREATALASGKQWMTAVGQRMGKSGDRSVIGEYFYKSNINVQEQGL